MARIFVLVLSFFNFHFLFSQSGNDSLSLGLDYINNQIKNGDRSVFMYKAQGEFNYLLGNHSMAIRGFRECFTLDNSESDCLLNLGVLFSEQGQLDSSNIYYSKLLSIDENNLDAKLGLSYNYIEQKEYEKAIKLCDAVLTIKPKYSEALNNKGLALMGLQKYNLALKAFSKALNIDDTQLNYRYNRGRCYTFLKQFDLAESDLMPAFKQNPNNDYLLSYLADLCLKTGRLSDACNYLNRLTFDVLSLKKSTQCNE